MRRGFLNWQIVRETHTRSAHDDKNGHCRLVVETAVLCVPTFLVEERACSAPQCNDCFWPGPVIRRLEIPQCSDLLAIGCL